MSHKQYLRDRLRQQMDEFVARGGRVRKVEAGASGQGSYDPRRTHQGSFSHQPTATRTPLPEVVAAIETRKKARATAKAKAQSRRQPRRRLIYDDFGEPLRWEWVDN
ncbi:MAG: hypothetical protein P1U67_11680 [Alcanivoracaceae bacterium]|nr:hypothetical protein [Alcanivoracaceae bacterium]